MENDTHWIIHSRELLRNHPDQLGYLLLALYAVFEGKSTDSWLNALPVEDLQGLRTVLLVYADLEFHDVLQDGASILFTGLAINLSVLKLSGNWVADYQVISVF